MRGDARRLPPVWRFISLRALSHLFPKRHGDAKKQQLQSAVRKALQEGCRQKAADQRCQRHKGKARAQKAARKTGCERDQASRAKSAPNAAQALAEAGIRQSPPFPCQASAAAGPSYPEPREAFRKSL